MRRFGALVAAAFGLMLLLSGSVARGGDAGNLLAGRVPTRSEGVRRARALTDGVQARSGEGWNTALSTVLSGRGSFVEYDLGHAESVDAIYLQADNNDAYVVSGSLDGQAFSELWVATPVQESGMRARFKTALGARARYLRLSARGGDGSYAVTELQVFAYPPATFPPRIEARSAPPTSLAVRDALLSFGLALAAFVLFAAYDLPWYGLSVLALVPAAGAVNLASAAGASWPLESRELSLLRAVAAGVALFALVRERLGRRLYPVHARTLDATLGLAACLAAASFYDCGHPQFWNERESRPEFVHQPDMRVYYPFAKYFDELGYDGVYQASVAAYVEDVPGVSLESLGRVEIRDMKTHRLDRVEDEAAAIGKTPARFTPERWDDFKRDMRYFRETMGDRGYLATHSDHGANATPVWVALARPWLAYVPASERVLWLGGLLDPALLGLMFAVVGLTFGLRSMLLAIVVFGATDLYMFGSNWAGATLRHDWIAYLGLGACALRRERWLTAGALLGLSIMIRAFPVVVLAGVGSALFVACVEPWLRERRVPNFHALLRAHEPALRVLAGTAACIVVSVAVTSALFGFGRWIEWWKKVALLDADIVTNDVSLRALVAFGNEQAPEATLKSRLVLYVVLWLCCGAVVLLTTSRVRLHQAALLALPLIVVIFNPANYYVHFIALLPLLGVDARSRSRAAGASAPEFSHLAISGPLLALCVAEYWTVLEPDFARHFQFETLLTFIALGFFYANVARALWPELGTEPPR